MCLLAEIIMGVVVARAVELWHSVQVNRFESQDEFGSRGILVHLLFLGRQAFFKACVIKWSGPFQLRLVFDKLNGTFKLAFIN